MPVSILHRGLASLKPRLAAASLLTGLFGADAVHAADSDPIAAQVRRRDALKPHHRWLGITTWASFAATTVLGTIRYANVIGFGDALCEPGHTPIFGRSWGCGDGLLYQHTVSAAFTTVSYISTRTLAALMPDPQHVAYPRLRIHRALSWVHLGGMAAMPVLGVLTSTVGDVEARNTLATVHLAVGYTTLAVISTAASLMAF
jgi:hypothetical protein